MNGIELATRRASAVRSESALVSCVFWAVFGALAAVSVDAVGHIYLGEIFALLIFLPLVRTRQWRIPHVWILLIGILFAAAQALSDINNHRPVAEALKGEGTPILFCVSILSYYMLFRGRPTRAYSLLTGVAITGLLKTTLSPDAYASMDPWKWGYGGAVLILLCVFFSAPKRRHAIWLVLTMLAFSLLSLAAGARSLGCLPMVGLLAYLFWQSGCFRHVKAWLRGHLAPLRLLLLLVPLVMLVNVAATGIFTSRWSEMLVGKSLAEKYQRQAASPLGLLLSARSESLVSIQAYLDAPLLGHGSWAVGPAYVREYSALLDRYGLTTTDPHRGKNGELIPTHSFILGALVWAGIMGGLFWCVLVYRILDLYLRNAAELPVYFHVFSVIFVWNVLFSPFGASARWGTALFIATFLCEIGVVRPHCKLYYSSALVTNWFKRAF